MDLHVVTIANGSDPAVYWIPQLVDSHAPINNPQDEAWRSAVKHGASVKTNDDDGDNYCQMSEVEEVEVLLPDHRKCRDEDEKHDHRRGKARKR